MKNLIAKEFASGLIFGEGPRWHDGRLYISDMLGERILSFDAEGRQTVVAEVSNRPNGLAFMPDGTLSCTPRCSMENSTGISPAARNSMPISARW